MGQALFAEYESVLARSEPFLRSPISDRERDALLAALISRCTWVRVYYLWRPNLPDEADNHLVELAVAGNAGAILVISSCLVLSGRPAAGTSVTPVRFDRHLSGARTTCCPTAAQLAAGAQRAAEPTAGCLGAASPTTAYRGS